MFKKSSCKLVLLLGALSCLMGAAQAENTETAPYRAVEFVGNTQFGDFQCGVSNQPVVYTLKNLTPAALALYNIHIINRNHSDTKIRVQVPAIPMASDCIKGTNPGLGQIGLIQANGACQLTLLVTTPACPASEAIQQILHIGVDNPQQEQLNKGLNADVTVLGTATDFAVLSIPQAPINAGGGDAQLVGDLGVVATDPASGFVVDGTVYTDALDTAVVNANTSFQTTYDSFTALTGCTPMNNISNGAPINAGTYCLSQKKYGKYVDITVKGKVHLYGSKNFIFLIDPVEHCGTMSTPRMCNLAFLANTSFVYHEGASPERVFWVSQDNVGETAGNDIFIATSARVGGTILTNHGNITADPTGVHTTIVCGSLWSENGQITLNGGMVDSNTEDFCSTYSAFMDGE